MPLVEAKEDSGSTNESFFELLRRLNSKDRDLLDRSTKAFVAFIRFYQEHQAKFIFRLKDLDISGVAKSFGLLRLPRMPELKGISSIDFKESPVNISEIKYKDPHRNKQRQQSFEALKKMKESGKKPSKREFELGPKTRSTDVTQKSSSNKLNLDELDDDWKEYKKLVKKNKSNK